MKKYLQSFLLDLRLAEKQLKSLDFSNTQKNLSFPESTQKRVNYIIKYANYQILLDKAKKSGSFLHN